MLEVTTVIFNFTEAQISNINKHWGQEAHSKLLNSVAIYSKKWGLSDVSFHEYYSVNATFFL